MANVYLWHKKKEDFQEEEMRRKFNISHHNLAD